MNVHGALLSHADDDARCFPGLETLMKETGLSKNTVIKSIRKLDELGLVEVRRGRQHEHNTYRLLDPRGSRRAPLDEPEVHGAHRREHSRGSRRAPAEVHGAHPNHTHRTKPIPPLPPVGAEGDFPANLNTEEFRSAWASWLTYKREKRKPVTPTERAAALALLSSWGPGRAASALRHTMAGGRLFIEEPRGLATQAAPDDAGRRHRTEELLKDAAGREPLDDSRLDQFSKKRNVKEKASDNRQ